MCEQAVHGAQIHRHYLHVWLGLVRLSELALEHAYSALAIAMTGVFRILGENTTISHPWSLNRLMTSLRILMTGPAQSGPGALDKGPGLL